jgi:hypothetical protein
MSEPGKEKEQSKPVRATTVWHPPFYDLMMESAPPTTEVRTEVVLSQQPRRADLLLLRRRHMPPRDHEARVLRGLWPLLGPVTLAELKGPTSGFRVNDLLRLISYGAEYHSLHMQVLAGPAELTLVLLTPAETPSLRDAIEHMSWRLERLDHGYARIAGAWYSTVIAFIDEVCEAERDIYLRLFSRHRKQSIEALHWMNLRRLRMTTMDNIHELEGYDEMVKRLASSLTPEERLAGLAPEERLAGLAPEERLAGLAPEERLAGLRPEDILRHYGLDELLRHLRDLTPAERAEAEAKLPPEMLAALRKYVDETP